MKVALFIHNLRQICRMGNMSVARLDDKGSPTAQHAAQNLVLAARNILWLCRICAPCQSRIFPCHNARLGACAKDSDLRNGGRRNWRSFGPYPAILIAIKTVGRDGPCALCAVCLACQYQSFHNRHGTRRWRLGPCLSRAAHDCAAGDHLACPLGERHTHAVAYAVQDQLTKKQSRRRVAYRIAPTASPYLFSDLS